MTNQIEFKTISVLDDLKQGLQILDIKQLAEIESNYKKVCQSAMADYKKWNRLYAQETDIIALLYGKLEGKMLRRRAEDAVSAYWVIRQDFRRWFHHYLAKTKSYPANQN